jgi:hypothetical protein
MEIINYNISISTFGCFKKVSAFAVYFSKESAQSSCILGL